MLKPRQIEHIIKGVSNHRRVQILELIHKNPDLSVLEVSETLNVNFKTISEHLQRLMIAGLVKKRNDNNAVRHILSPQGTSILKFLRTLE